MPSLRPLLGFLKHALLGRDVRVRSIRFGAARGLRMRIDPNAKTQRVFGLDEREIQSEFVRFARWADTLLDVGSSDGYYGLIFRRHNPDGTIHLIDADPDFAAQQRAHFELNFPGAPLPTIHSRLVGAPDAAEPSHLILSRDLPLRGRRVFFKIDVDGWELDILRSAEALLPHAECRFLIETHSAELERNCTEFLATRGFTVRIIPNAWWRAIIPEHRPIPHNRWLSAYRA
jgi:hypothetical protein